ncbi:MAG TPA: acetyltransferase [Arenimonas sp.]|nr:acetyltransferase [Arenimonas sp.]
MIDLLIYGNGKLAEFACQRFEKLGNYRVVGFTVDRAVLGESELLGRPVVAFEDVIERFPPQQVQLFIAVGPVRINRIRRERFEQAKALGYRFASYIAPTAVIADDCELGENILIAEACVVQPGVRLGDNVHLGTSCVVAHHSHIGAHAFLAVAVVVSGTVEIGEAAFLGANSTVRDRVRIGARCVVGAGVTIPGDTADGSVYSAPAPILLPIGSDQIPL